MIDYCYERIATNNSDLERLNNLKIVLEEVTKSQVDSLTCAIKFKEITKNLPMVEEHRFNQVYRYYLGTQLFVQYGIIRNGELYLNTICAMGNGTKLKRLIFFDTFVIKIDYKNEGRSCNLIDHRCISFRIKSKELLDLKEIEGQFYVLTLHEICVAQRIFSEDLFRSLSGEMIIDISLLIEEKIFTCEQITVTSYDDGRLVDANSILIFKNNETAIVNWRNHNEIVLKSFSEFNQLGIDFGSVNKFDGALIYSKSAKCSDKSQSIFSHFGCLESDEQCENVNEGGRCFYCNEVQSCVPTNYIHICKFEVKQSCNLLYIENDRFRTDNYQISCMKDIEDGKTEAKNAIPINSIMYQKGDDTLIIDLQGNVAEVSQVNCIIQNIMAEDIYHMPEIVLKDYTAEPFFPFELYGFNGSQKMIDKNFMDNIMCNSSYEFESFMFQDIIFEEFMIKDLHNLVNSLENMDVPTEIRGTSLNLTGEVTNFKATIKAKDNFCPNPSSRIVNVLFFWAFPPQIFGYIGKNFTLDTGDTIVKFSGINFKSAYNIRIRIDVTSDLLRVNTFDEEDGSSNNFGNIGSCLDNLTNNTLLTCKTKIMSKVQIENYQTPTMANIRILSDEVPTSLSDRAAQINVYKTPIMSRCEFDIINCESKIPNSKYVNKLSTDFMTKTQYLSEVVYNHVKISLARNGKLFDLPDYSDIVNGKLKYTLNIDKQYLMENRIDLSSFPNLIPATYEVQWRIDENGRVWDICRIIFTDEIHKLRSSIDDICSTEDNKLIIYLGVLAGIIALLLMFLMIIGLRNYHLNKLTISNSLKDNSLYSDKFSELKMNLRCKVIPIENIKFEKLVGSGNFGKVFQGKLDNSYSYGKMNKPEDKYVAHRNLFETIAIKTVNSDLIGVNSKFHRFFSRIQPDSYLNQRTELLKEAIIMNDLITKIDHPNVVPLLCICLSENILDLTPYIIMPYYDRGDLITFLKTNKLSIKQKILFCIQAVRGIDAILKCGIIHRDLSARNCLVTCDMELAISDFGLARQLFQSSNKQLYTAETEHRLPFRSMSPECLKKKNFNCFTEIWATGVLFWEIFYEGRMPYEELDNEPGDIVQNLYRYLKAGKRLTNDERIPKKLYSLMLKMWDDEPSNRPETKIIIKILEMI
ncbi:hypothetical protein SNEBB_002240 [Seison nebaliae]|nr:hypothetical protein SNEBB_002240 [Seison nebaliae]